MSPLFRLWAMIAVAFAVLFALRGAFLAALAVLLLSPAPVLAFNRGSDAAARASLHWLAAVAIAVALMLGLVLAIVSFGGLPQVHEWRALLRGA